MHWEQLIDELEAAVDAEDRRELAAEVADRTRRELARVHLLDRLRAGVGSDVTVGLDGAGPLRGRLSRVGPDWFLLEGDPTAELLVVAAAMRWIAGLPARAVDPAAVSVVDQRLGLGSVLRAAARDRRFVQAWLRGGGEIRGLVGRVGGDFVELGADQRESDATTERCLPFAAIAVVRLT